MHGGKSKGSEIKERMEKKRTEVKGEPKLNVFFVTRIFVFLQTILCRVVLQEKVPELLQGVGSQPFCEHVGEVVFGLHIFDVEVLVFVCLLNPMVLDVHEPCMFEVHNAASCNGDGGLVVTPDSQFVNQESKLLFEFDHKIEVICCGVQGDVF